MIPAYTHRSFHPTPTGRNFMPVLLGLILLLSLGGGLLVYLSKQGSLFPSGYRWFQSQCRAIANKLRLSSSKATRAQTAAVRLESGSLIKNKINLGEENSQSAIAPNIQSSLVRHKEASQLAVF